MASSMPGMDPARSDKKLPAPSSRLSRSLSSGVGSTSCRLEQSQQRPLGGRTPQLPAAIAARPDAKYHSLHIVYHCKKIAESRNQGRCLCKLLVKRIAEVVRRISRDDEDITSNSCKLYCKTARRGSFANTALASDKDPFQLCMLEDVDQRGVNLRQLFRHQWGSSLRSKRLILSLAQGYCRTHFSTVFSWTARQKFLRNACRDG